MRTLDERLRLDEREGVGEHRRWRSCRDCGGGGWSAPWTRCECGAPPSVEEADSWLPPEVERVDDLVPEAMLTAQRDRWLAIGLATGPSDRELARAGVRLAYQAVGLEPPEVEVWVEDPMRGAIAAAQLAETLNQVWDHVGGQVGNQVRNQVWNQVRDQVWNQVRDPVWNQVRGQVVDQVVDQVGDQVYQACYGSQDAHWLAYHETCLRLGLRAALALRGLSWAAEAAGWWWPFAGAVVFSERPAIYEPGVRVVYPSGWEVAL